MNQLKLRNRRAKIVATLGPACETEKTIEELFLAGVDVFRLNFSHGSQEDHIKKVKIVRKLEKKHNRYICILGDLQGPKFRVGKFTNVKEQLKKIKNLLLIKIKKMVTVKEFIYLIKKFLNLFLLANVYLSMMGKFV